MSKYDKINVRIDSEEVWELTKKGANLIITWNGQELTIPKVLNGHRQSYHATEKELRDIKLKPAAPPIGYGLQQFNGSIFYLYNKNKTKKFQLSDDEKAELKEYRRKLKLRKTCPVCNKVQKRLNDIISRYLANMKLYNSCWQCYTKINDEIEREVEAKREDERKQRRAIKHDFTSYFIEKGISLDYIINESERYETVYLDFETTGLSSKHDEILQVSLIDYKGRVLMHKLCKPSVATWDDAMNIHGITPKDVENGQPFEYYVKDISSILLRLKTIVCYDCSFEIGFLDKYDVKYSDNGSTEKFIDCMLMFAEVYGEWSDYFESYKWQKLTTAAMYYNYDFEGQEHNSLADVFATKFVYEKMIANSSTI